jgi:signal transduction histidine kinase
MSDAMQPSETTNPVRERGIGRAPRADELARITQEITDRTQAEQDLARSLMELSRTNEELRVAGELTQHFLAITSHELRNPIATAITFASTLRTRWGSIPDEQKLWFVEVIDRQARRLARLVDDLMTLTRLQEGVLQTEPTAIEVADAIHDALEQFAEERAPIEVTCPPGLLVLADWDHLQQIIANYIGNALKYGEVPISLEATAAGPMVEIRVRDSGEGVPAEFLPHLFDRFARADTTATRRAQGTGLGLSIVRSLAEAQGGEAWYEPNIPTGACFGVRLPKSVAVQESIEVDDDRVVTAGRA